MSTTALPRKESQIPGERGRWKTVKFSGGGGTVKLEENIGESADNLETEPMKAIEQKKDPK